MYKKGSENKVVYALSQRDEDLTGQINSLSVVEPRWISEIKQSYEHDDLASKILASAVVHQSSEFSVTNGRLRFKGRLYVGKSGNLRDKLISSLHDSSVGGHSGAHAAY